MDANLFTHTVPVQKKKKKNSANRDKVQQCTHQSQMTTVLSHRFHVLFIIQTTQASAPAGFTDSVLEVVPTA